VAAVSILETRALTKAYAGVLANNSIDFALERGKITALIGPNGAGKSTFVGMISGRIAATSGDVLFEGQSIAHLPAHKRIQLGIAYTFQITSVFGGLSCHENVALAARRLTGSDRAALEVRVADALDRVGLSDRATQIAGDLSYGHQRLLEIAMGLVQAPSLFILDEPTQGLSEAEVQAFMALMRSLAGETTILLIEHNMSVVMQTADRITVLNYGEVLASGTPDEVRGDPHVQAAYLGTADA
jgi:branched-chain amino acid transport system ATP-binding protein